MPVKISLKAARVNAGLTLLEAAEKLGIGKDRLIKWENNPGLVSPIYQARIQKVYGLPLDCIFFGI